jgi:hypothetical protein
MTAPVVAITDGGAPAVAVVHWLRQHGLRAELIEAQSSEDAARLAAARQQHRPRPRVIALFEPPVQAALDGSAALAVASNWLQELPAIEQRGGAGVIEERRLQQAAGHATLTRLLKLATVSGPAVPKATRGRPRGVDPFRGVGFDSIVAMLLEPKRRWTERELADVVGRSPSSVNRVLRELHQRGYVDRSRGATRVADDEMLRDDVLATWRGRVADRAVHVLATPRRRAPREIVGDLQAAGERCLLAGASASDAAEGLVEAAVTIYGSEQALAALRRAGCRDSVPGLGNLIVWTAPERAVFSQPRLVVGVEATNRVVTYLDLATGTGSRAQAAALAAWSEQ